MPGTLTIWLMIGLMFAPIGAIMAALITYGEYSQHRLPKGRVLREVLISAVFAFLVLLALIMTAGWAMSRTGDSVSDYGRTEGAMRRGDA